MLPVLCVISQEGEMGPQVPWCRNQPKPQIFPDPGLLTRPYTHSACRARSSCSRSDSKSWPRPVARRAFKSKNSHVKDRRTRVAESTTHKELSGLRRFLKWCRRKQIIAEVPFVEPVDGTTGHDEQLALSKEQTFQLIQKLPERFQDYATFQWWTAFRPGTMARLKWTDIDLDAKTVELSAAQDKGRYARKLPLAPDAAAVLARRPNRSGLVWKRVRIHEALKAAARDSGLSDAVAAQVKPYTLRHSRLTHIGQRTSNVVGLMHFAGHKHLGTTMKYLHADLVNTRRMLEDVDS